MSPTHADRLFTDLVSAQGPEEALNAARRLVGALEVELGGASQAGDRYAGRRLDVAELLAQPELPVPWRCEGIVADGFLTVLAGRGGEGKSWLALALACGVAEGKDAAGIACEAGRSVIFDAENGKSLIARRLRSAGIEAGVAVQPFDAGGLAIARDLEWFRSRIKDEKADLVVFDSLRVLTSGAKESDSDQMEPLITALKLLSRETGAAILLIHHRGKSELNSFRGSSVILDQTDLMLTLGRVSGDPEGRRRRRVTSIKCRIDEEPGTRWIAIEADPKLGTVSVVEAEPFDDGTGAGAPQQEVLREPVLALLTEAPQPQARIAKALGRSGTDGTVRRVLASLEVEDLVEKSQGGWRLPSRV